MDSQEGTGQTRAGRGTAGCNKTPIFLAPKMASLVKLVVQLAIVLLWLHPIGDWCFVGKGYSLVNHIESVKCSRFLLFFCELFCALLLAGNTSSDCQQSQKTPSLCRSGSN